LGWFCGGLNSGLNCGLFGLEAAKVGQGTAHDAVGLGTGAVDCGLGAEQVVVQHGIAGGLFGEGGFDLGTAVETPGGADYFGSEQFLERGLRTQIVPKGAGEGFVFFGLVRLDAVLC
jgi:hypothetical protein